ncbi:hypothetical protein LOD99_8028 [Oopsacas minuta]|uniref:Uncharacterized protein n=1 Tax=Oopsacas minuta TaxID=111878 RepID=A0AAV7JIM0_9METZ|nr:hypothetical protein LOD99_8028 [Oopsacas minuta]
MLNQNIQLSLRYENEAKHKFIIGNLQDLKAELYYIVLPDNWLVGILTILVQGLFFLVLLIKLCQWIYLEINSFLSISAWFYGQSIPTFLNSINDIRQIESLLHQISSKSVSDDHHTKSHSFHIPRAKQHVEKVNDLASIEDSENYSSSVIAKLQFIFSQVDNIFIPNTGEGFSAKNKHALVCPDLDSARRPIPHDISLPIPIPKPQQIKIGSDMVEDVHADSTDANYVPEDELLEPQTFTQGVLNDLVRDLDLSKDKAELLASRLKQKNLLDKDVLVSHYRKRNFDLAQYYTTDGPLCYCNDIEGLYANLIQEHSSSDWCLFIDSSKRSL